MDTEKKQENCYLCGKKLNPWFTSLKKIDGNKVCSSCSMKTSMKEIREEEARKEKLRAEKIAAGGGQELESLGIRIQKLGVKLTVGLTLPIVFLFLGLFTLPFGIIFWILGIILLAGLFTNKK